MFLKKLDIKNFSLIQFENGFLIMQSQNNELESLKMKPLKNSKYVISSIINFTLTPHLVPLTHDPRKGMKEVQ